MLKAMHRKQRGPSHPGGSPPTPVSQNRFFTVVEGLRGIAVTAVVLFHASVPHMSGGFVGVDLFFVISGFLITGLLLREFERTGRVSIRGFFARRARRIVPPAALVIVITSVAVWFLLPTLSIFKQAFDLLAAALNFANWRFIAQGKDYLAGVSDNSVSTHFWSLSVEEQFYFVWPLLIIGSVYLARRAGWSLRMVVGMVVAVVTATSLCASIRLTTSDPTLAYMATHTRVWQFGVGALIAIVGPLLTGSMTKVGARVTATIVGWAGMAAIAASCLCFDHATSYPGTAALLPTLGGGAVIAAGQVSGNTLPSVGAVLSLAWLRWIGSVSYAWYLWHWPVIVLFREYTGITDWRVLVTVMFGALLLAWISTVLLERPLMSSSELKANFTASIAVGLTGIVVAATATMSLGVFAVRVASASVSSSATPLTFEQVFGPNTGTNSGAVRPNPFQAFEDRPPRDDCLVPLSQDRTPDSCVYGPDNGVPAVLFGDSHAHQWLPAVAAIGKQYDWRLHQFTKAACPAPSLKPRDGRTDPFARSLCQDWRADAIRRIKEIHPKYIVMSSLSIYVPEYQELKNAWEETLAELRTTGAKLLYIRDTPHPEGDAPECISGTLDDWSKCDFDLNNEHVRLKKEPIVTDQVRGENLDISVFDFTPYLCDGNRCHVVRNGILLYRDDSHLSATAAQVLAGALREMIRAGNIDLSGSG